MPKIRNIIIFVAIALALILIYIFLVKPPADQANLVSSSSGSTLPSVNGAGGPVANTNTTTLLGTQDFLSLLLNIKNIKLDDSILSDPAFNSLHDSSIVLTPDGTEGRPNPFAQFGNDTVAVPTNNTPNTTINPPTSPLSPTTPISPTPNPTPGTNPVLNPTKP